MLCSGASSWLRDVLHISYNCQYRNSLPNLHSCIHRKASAPESYGSRPKSKTLEEGRYRRPPPERVGGVTEDAVRGDDYEVVDGPSFGVGTLVGVLLAIATLGGAYLTVEKLQQGPVAPREGAVRMPATDRS